MMRVQVDVLESHALFSPCESYRYYLSRTWDAALGHVNFIMLNPSTADASVDDPTVRRCGLYARRWGYGGLVVTNLFAWRATDPSELRVAVDPVGPDTDAHILRSARQSALVVCAWGVHGSLHGRDAAVLELLNNVDALGLSPLHCLRTTKGGHPAHPLYLPGSLVPRRLP
jgi:hypothetical protein